MSIPSNILAEILLWKKKRKILQLKEEKKRETKGGGESDAVAILGGVEVGQGWGGCAESLRPKELQI